MNLRQLIIQALKENYAPAKQPEVRPQPSTKPQVKPQPKPQPIRRPLTPGKEVPKTPPKAEALSMHQNQWEQIETEVYSRLQALFHEISEQHGIDESDFNEMIVNSIRKHRLRENNGETNIVDKITQRFKELGGK
jgi:hypothetical protein